MKKTRVKRKAQKKEPPSGVYFAGSADIRGNFNTGTVSGNMEYKSTEVHDIGPGAQVAAGNERSNVNQYQGLRGQELEVVRKLFADLRTELEKKDLPEATKLVSKEYVDQIEQEITRKDAQPDGSVIKVAGNWLLKNVPAIAGTLANLFINPIVGKVVEAAGELASKWAKEKFFPETKGV